MQHNQGLVQGDRCLRWNAACFQHAPTTKTVGLQHNHKQQRLPVSTAGPSAGRL